MKYQSDQKIIDSLLSGDDKGFKDFYKRELRLFIVWSKKEWNMNDEAAHDLYQDVQMYVYENIIKGKLTNLSSSLRTYLYAIAKNQISLKFRKSSTANDHEASIIEHLIFLSGSEQEDDAKQNKVRLVKKAITTMLDPCKSLLKLFYYDNLSFKVISQRLGYKNESVAKNQKKRCLDRLRNNYSEELKSMSL